MFLIITTLHKKESAVAIGKALLKNKYIVCYNLFPIESAYWWKGKIIEENEVMMIMKTRTEFFEKIEKFIKEHSGYDVPEVIGFAPDKTNTAYLKWITEEI
jgi:periplasmic divalent cation tolerance protein